MDAMHAPVYFKTYDIKKNMNHMPESGGLNTEEQSLLEWQAQDFLIWCSKEGA